MSSVLLPTFQSFNSALCMSFQCLLQGSTGQTAAGILFVAMHLEYAGMWSHDVYLLPSRFNHPSLVVPLREVFHPSQVQTDHCQPRKTGVIILPTQTMHYFFREIPPNHNLHLHCLIPQKNPKNWWFNDPPKKRVGIFGSYFFETLPQPPKYK